MSDNEVEPLKVLSNVKLHWPSAREWMWNYCVYLGGYIDEEHTKYDLGIYIGEFNNSMAIVYGPDDGNYISGPCKKFAGVSDVYKETIKRAKALGLL